MLVYSEIDRLISQRSVERAAEKVDDIVPLTIRTTWLRFSRLKFVVDQLRNSFA